MPVPLVSVEELRAKADQPARRDAKLEPTRPLPWFTIFVITPRRAPAIRDHDALKFLGDVDHQVLDRLHSDAVDLLRHDLRPRYLHLESLAPHHLDQDRELELAAADHLQLLGRVGILDAQ